MISVEDFHGDDDDDVAVLISALTHEHNRVETLQCV